MGIIHVQILKNQSSEKIKRKKIILKIKGI